MCPKRNKLFCFICLVMGGNQSAWTQEGFSLTAVRRLIKTTATVKLSDPLACQTSSGWGKYHQIQSCSNLSRHARSTLVPASVRLVPKTD
ncbi:hypothetical protein NQ318_009204 [Aromia moschata]|uniref:Secreted protein n=1 Tax=Aromia moschata TaxID=1265417 RepID=A0AAV8XT62_9CUCU|nr:hypothetical protein NQ318_009204 [Aromia moschata]